MEKAGDTRSIDSINTNTINHSNRRNTTDFTENNKINDNNKKDETNITQSNQGGEIKIQPPLLRGLIHLTALITLIILFITMILAHLITNKRLYRPITLYMVSKITLLTVSSIYHLYKKEEGISYKIVHFNNTTTYIKNNKGVKLFLQKADRIGIFLLITGSQCSLLFSLYNVLDERAKRFVYISNIYLIIGVLKMILAEEPAVFKIYNDLINTLIYIFHGGITVIYSDLFLERLSGFDILSIVIGLGFYGAGGLVFSLELPRIRSNWVGYHEVWHFNTLAGKVCVGVPIVVRYFGWWNAYSINYNK